MASAPLGALYPGVLSTGLKTPKVHYRGNAWMLTKVSCYLGVVSSGANVIVQFRRGAGEGAAALIGTVTITAGNHQGETTGLSVSVADKDWFEIWITQVGTTPNEGSDLDWKVAP